MINKYKAFYDKVDKAMCDSYAKNKPYMIVLLAPCYIIFSLLFVICYYIVYPFVILLDYIGKLFSKIKKKEFKK